MGTRSLTYVYDDGEPILCMYRQFDGYPSGHGAELADFLLPIDLINGFEIADQGRKAANGMGCLAAQLVAHFKKGIGGIYLYATRQNHDCWQEYEYHVFEKRVIVKNPGEVMFDGCWFQFKNFCSSEELV
jgi:hypothetical protein